MISERIQDKGILAKILETYLKILITKECKTIGKLKINIIASSIQIIKGITQEITIIAKDINYKDLFFDEVELEAKDVKIRFKINSKELNFKNNFTLKFKISLSEDSLQKVLYSNNWVGDIISKEIFNQSKLEDIRIENDQILIKASKDKESINEWEKVCIKVENDKLYLENKSYNKSIRIPIEDKVLFKDVNIKNNLINIFAKSSISF